MKSLQAASIYKESSLETAPPLKIIHMLYEGAIRFLMQAEEIGAEAPAVEFTKKLRRADSIVCELRLSLDHEIAPDVSASLTSLYLFVEAQIQEALIERELEPVRHARRVLTKLYEGWKTVEVTPLSQGPVAG